jgi:hypothetical protein
MRRRGALPVVLLFRPALGGDRDILAIVGGPVRVGHATTVIDRVLSALAPATRPKRGACD